ncbi:hypothetical protein SDC9_138822 [bioreactor metagenome]|uniref:Uncharacterized protein n=1 Tax=bioreactor metagenome TaxID=1076179 RepID=A0A645DQD2_9ZZZZ
MVTRLQIGNYTLLNRTIRREALHLLRKGRQQFGQGLGHANRFLARRHLKKAPTKQEEHEHGDRVEINFATLDKGCPATCQKGRPHTERHRHIHPDPAQLDIPPGVPEERRRRIEDDGQRQQQTGPTHQTLDIGRHVAIGDIHRIGIHHHLHHPETGDPQAPQGIATLLAGYFLILRGIVGIRTVTDGGNRSENIGKFDA